MWRASPPERGTVAETSMTTVDDDEGGLRRSITGKQLFFYTGMYRPARPRITRSPLKASFRWANGRGGMATGGVM